MSKYTKRIWAYIIPQIKRQKLLDASLGCLVAEAELHGSISVYVLLSLVTNKIWSHVHTSSVKIQFVSHQYGLLFFRVAFVSFLSAIFFSACVGINGYIFFSPWVLHPFRRNFFDTLKYRVCIDFFSNMKRLLPFTWIALFAECCLQQPLSI